MTAAPAYRPEFLQRLELLAYDARMGWTHSPVLHEPRVVVVDIDDKSLERVGRWPWSRATFAQFVSVLREHYQVAEIGLDILFVDEVCQGEAADQHLAAALQEYLPVMAISLQTQPNPDSRHLQNGEAGQGVRLHGIENVPPAERWWGEALGYVSNLGEFITPQTVIGHISPQYDVDGKVRRIQPVFAWDGRYYDTLSLAIVRQYFGLDTLYWDAQTRHWLDSPKLRIGAPDSALFIPVNHAGETLIPYRTVGQLSPYQRFSAVDVLQKQVAIEDLADKFVLVGTSATGQGDIVSTPLATTLPGVEVHATLLSALLDSSEAAFKSQPAQEGLLQTSFLIIFGSLLLFAYRFGIVALLISAPLLFLLWVGVNVWLWVSWQLAVEFLPSALLITALTATLVLSSLLEISQRHRHIHRLFGFYLPSVVVQRLANDRSGKDWLKAERRSMTVLFADVHGFTAMADALSPEAVAQITYQLFSRLTEVIHQHGGTVDKYMGDAIMAFWGAPLPDEEHALHAAQAAQVMQQAVAELNATTFAGQNIRIKLGIGLNSGDMVVGNLGSALRHTYTVMGAAVNVASAIQQLTRRYPHDILCGESTAQRLPPALYLDIGSADIKKLKHPIRIFAVKSANIS